DCTSGIARAHSALSPGRLDRQTHRTWCARCSRNIFSTSCSEANLRGFDHQLMVKSRRNAFPATAILNDLLGLPGGLITTIYVPGLRNPKRYEPALSVTTLYPPMLTVTPTAAPPVCHLTDPKSELDCATARPVSIESTIAHNMI